MTDLTDTTQSAYARPGSEITDGVALLVSARLGRRLANLIVDWILIVLVAEWLLPWVWLVTVERQLAAQIDFDMLQTVPGVLFPLTVLFYYASFETLSGRTPGKFLSNTQVVSRDGTKPGFWRIVWRSLCRLIPFEIMSIFLSADRRCWHDTLSDTYVVTQV